jgi:glyoxylase-like metal-dependent hydrolase (beta-lactamase superfamily II)
MLGDMKSAEPKAMKNTVALINSHSNGDHCNGNNCVKTNEIISSQATLDEMAHESPEIMANLIDNASNMGELGEFFLECFGHFDFKNVTRKLPNSTFNGETSRRVGDKEVKLFEVGPAHTHGDVIVFVPDDKVVFTGDILFIEGHPILWAGPVSNWIDACNRIIRLDVENVVPGHGPVTDKKGVEAVRDYLSYIHQEAKIRFEGGMEVLEACKDIDLKAFSSWGDSERIAVNVNSLYREFKGEQQREDVTILFTQMAELAHNN